MQRHLVTFTTPVRGHAFAGNPPEGAKLVGGAPARLVREPDNPRDGHAVAVWVDTTWGGWRIGYLERAVAVRMAGRLDDGLRVEATLEGWIPEPEGRWLRPALRVAAA